MATIEQNIATVPATESDQLVVPEFNHQWGVQSTLDFVSLTKSQSASDSLSNLPHIELTDSTVVAQNNIELPKPANDNWPKPANDNNPPPSPGGAVRMPVPIAA